MKVLIDTCVIIDILQKREPFYRPAMKILLAISNQIITGIITAKSLADIYYITRRSIHDETIVRRHLQTLFTLFEVVDTYASDCQFALSSEMKDYEDAIMVETALRIGADCIVTRNLKDYVQAKIPVLSTEDFLMMLYKQE